MFIRPFTRHNIVALLGLTAVLFISYHHAYSQKAARFNATGDYIEVPHSASLAPSKLTVEFWLKVYAIEDTSLVDQQTVLDKRGETAPGYILYLTGNQFPLRLDATLNPIDIMISRRIDPNIWYHIAITQDADSAKSYFDGRLRSSTPNAYTANTTTPLRMGEYLGFPATKSSFRGEIDELRIWNYARSQEEIKSTMYKKMTGDETGLAAYWDFDSQSDSVIPDLTANGNDGVMYGNASLVDSDAPVGFKPPLPPVGLRAYGGDGVIELAWKAGDSSVAAYTLYRADSRFFTTDSSMLIATIAAPDSIYTDTQVVAGQNYYYKLRTIDQEGHNSRAGKTTMGRLFSHQQDYMTGVHYFQWYGTPTDLAHHIDGESLRSFLVPEQPPMLGYYSSRDPHVIRKHLEWMQSYGIDFITVIWDIDDTWEKTTLIDHILPILAGSNIKFMVVYGAHSLAREFPGGPVVIDSELAERLVNDFIGMTKDYFDHPNYLTINSRYAVYMYISRLFTGDYVQAFQTVRAELKSRGYDLYLIGDEMGFDNLREQHVQFVDAVSPYIVWDGSHDGYPIDTDYFADLTMQADRWEDVTIPSGIPIIPNATMGLNKRWEDPTVITLPPQSTAGAACTSTLEEAIKAMLPFVDPGLNMMLITAWNEWHEDTILEPIVITPPTSTDVTESGSFYTQGYLYEGHGFKPLELVRDLLAPGLSLPTVNHFTFTAGSDSTYSISVSEASMYRESLEVGDEIGVFDGNLCVGAVAVTGNWPLGFWAWIDRSDTEAKDGFLTGNGMSFQIWDASSSQKFTAAATYTNGDGTFGDAPYAQVSLLSRAVLIEPDSTVEMTLATDSSIIALAFTGGGGVTIAFTSGEVAGDTVSVTYMETAPQELPTTATFEKPLYYLDIRTTARDYMATLRFGYTESLVQAQGISEADLGAAVWEADTMRWKSPPVTVDTAENTVTVSTDHLSLWALVSTKEKLITGFQHAASLKGLPDKFTLEQNYPNPFNPETTIRYELPKPTHVKLVIYNLLGERVKILVDEKQSAGSYSVQWDGKDELGRNSASGLYLYRLQVDNLNFCKKLVLIR